MAPAPLCDDSMAAAAALDAEGDWMGDDSTEPTVGGADAAGDHGLAASRGVP